MRTKFYFRMVMLCVAFFMFMGISAQQTHLAIPIVDGNDDAEEASLAVPDWEIEVGDVSRGSSDLELYWDDVPQYIGTLFRDVQIPAGATISKAYIQFVAKTDSDAAIDLQIYGVDSAQVDSIKAISFGVSGKARTTAMVDWAPAPWLAEFDVLEAQQTPDLSAIVTEIIAKDGWAAGNNMMFVLTGTVNEDANRNAYSFDMDEEGPVFHVWYTEAVAEPDHLAIPIVDGNDDAEEASLAVPDWEIEVGDVSRGSSDLELYWDDVPQYIGTLFRDVQIPAGATISKAYIQFVAKTDSDAAIDLQIYGVDSAQVDSIKAISFGVSGKARTTAMVDWAPAPWLAEFDVLEAQQTPDLSAIVTEIIAKDGWAAGNNMMFVLTGTVNEDANRNAYSFDMDEEGPVFHVWFTGGGTTGVKDLQSYDLQTVVYPNPAEGRLYIENSSSDISSYNIYSISGMLVGGKHSINSSKVEVDLSSLTKGMYLINVISGEKSETHKVVVK